MKTRLKTKLDCIFAVVTVALMIWIQLDGLTKEDLRFVILVARGVIVGAATIWAIYAGTKLIQLVIDGAIDQERGKG